MKKRLGFYLTAVSAVLALVSIFLYGSVTNSNAYVRPLLAVSVVLSLLVLAVTMAKGSMPGGNVVTLINSALCMAAVGLATIPVISMIVFVAMGMNAYSTIASFVVFAVVAFIAWILNIISAFSGITE